MIPETMRRKERVDAAIALEKPDRVPVMPLMISFPIRHKGMTQAEAWRDLDKAFQATVDTFDELGGFDILAKTNIYWPMLGGRFANAPVRNLIPGRELPENALAQIQERELFTREDYDRIASLGWNAFWEEHYPVMANKSLDRLATAQNILLERYCHEKQTCEERGIPVLLGAAVDSVLMAFSLSRTLTQFTMDLFEVPDKVQAAMEATCDDLIQNTLDTIAITKGQIAFIVLERGSGAIYRLELFERFEWPYLQRYVDAFVLEGITPWLHLDTDWGLNLPYFNQLPKGKCVADLDGNTDIFKAKEILDGHMCISGDVRADILSLGQPMQIREYCQRLIDDVGKDGGFLLTTGCECPVDAKFENVKMMVDVAKTYGGKVV
ncbi:MAG: uroporphyrinogen decarboxylase family protein [Desulfobacteraceae bacterium]|jgi:uroporphyrinogen-III decarboxylase